MSGLDLEQYISNYSGTARVKRLTFIAQKNKEQSKQALQLLIKELKAGINTTAYKEVIEQAQKTYGGEFTLDDAWIQKVDAESQKRLEKLESELNSYRTNMIKESIRMAYNDIGDFYSQRGDLQNALKSYLKARDYNTTVKHVITMCMNIIKVSIEMNNYALVGQYVGRAEQTLTEPDNVTVSKIKVAAALAELDAKKYKQVARKLISETDIAIDKSFNDVISPQDIAIIGGLCALASYDRKELKTQVLQNESYKNFLELVPSMRELLSDFYESKYSSFVANLEKIKPEIFYDVYFYEHAKSIFEKIRSKALIQYCSPFTSVDLKKMAVVFNTSVESLEKDIAKLIVDKQIKARIDSHKKILYARVTDQRNNAYQNVVEFGDSFIRDTEAHLLRMNLMKHRDFAVKPARKGNKPMMMMI